MFSVFYDLMIGSLTPPGNSALMEAVAANGVPGVQSAVAGATKRRLEERSAFDKRLRFSVRQTESAYRYRDIVVKKQDGFTHILLSTKSSENNTLNPEVRPRPLPPKPNHSHLTLRLCRTVVVVTDVCTHAVPSPSSLGDEGDPERHGDGGIR